MGARDDIEAPPAASAWTPARYRALLRAVRRIADPGYAAAWRGWIRAVRGARPTAEELPF